MGFFISKYKASRESYNFVTTFKTLHNRKAYKVVFYTICNYKVVFHHTKMKQKLSITIDEHKIKIIEELLKEGMFRSKSHVLEYSLNKFLKNIGEN
jgi:hypothetical protein